MTMTDGTSTVRTRKRQRQRKTVHLPFGYRVRRRVFYRFLLVSILLTAAVILLPFALYHYLSDESHIEGDLSDLEAIRDDTIDAAASSLTLPDAAEPSAEYAPPPEAPEPTMLSPEGAAEPSLQSILETYRTATGLRDVRSLVLHGEYTEDGRRFEMILTIKAPDLMRKALSDDRLSIVCSYDGKDATVQIGQKTPESIEDAFHHNALILVGAFLTLADTGSEGQSARHRWLSDQTHDGKICRVIASQLPDTPTIHHLIEPDTGFECFRYLDITVEGKRHRISMHLGDFRKNGGYTLPHTYRVEVDGSLRGKARIDSIQSNQGIMPWMFSMDAAHRMRQE